MHQVHAAHKGSRAQVAGLSPRGFVGRIFNLALVPCDPRPLGRFGDSRSPDSCLLQCSLWGRSEVIAPTGSAVSFATLTAPFSYTP